ncbi:hypothetical protein ACFB49_07060 [Sphingomonas sp. DBB INV C78]|uniref:TetR/AcrR family transcriptional regulator n=1 Tax=Sphingomonas sp. DBB INV C78 TaxID=3349434 RepID=UPI0036D3B9B7
MNSTAGTKAAKAPRRAATRERLMASAEQLIGLKGIDGVSLEEIAKHAGQANKYAVQYHFVSREGLIQAILDTRIAAIEQRRRALLDHIDLSSVNEILNAFVLPLAEQVDENGECAFARFLLQFATQFQPWSGIVHPLVSAGEDSASHALSRALATLFPHIPEPVLGQRLILLMHLPLRVLLPDEHQSAVTRAARLDDTVAMIAAALAAPLSRA